ncbi:MAG: PEP-CTERM sorting domain-containing protein [Phycisphaerales bacterium JB039]
MLYPQNRLLAASLFACLGAAAAGRQPQLIEVGLLPRGTWSVGSAISADGTAAAGYCRVPSGIRAFHWAIGGPMVDLGVASMWDTEVYAGAISADGTAVVGHTHSFLVTGSHAFRWTAAEGMRDLGYLPGGEWAWANDCSADGAIVVGGCETPDGDRAFRWTASGGLESLGTLPGGASSSAAAVTPDGMVITGLSDSADGFQVFRWTAPAGMEGLGRLPGEVMAAGSDISATGEVIVGTSGDFGGPSRAIVWTRDEGLRELGILPGYSRSQARAISGDGRIIAGFSARGDFHTGTMWLPLLGMVDANEYLASAGVDRT